MKTMIEVQFNGNNVTDKDLDKYVKETLKAQGVKTTDVDTLSIYYVPESAKLFYVANKKDGEELNGELDVNAMPDYSVAPVKKAPAKKAPAKKAVAAKEAKPVAKTTKTTRKTAAKKTTKK